MKGRGLNVTVDVTPVSQLMMSLVVRCREQQQIEVTRARLTHGRPVFSRLYDTLTFIDPVRKAYEPKIKMLH